MAVHLVKTIVTNLGDTRRLDYLPPNGRVVGSFETVTIPGLLDGYLYLAKKEALLAQFYAEQSENLIDVVFEIEGITGSAVLATDNADMAALATAADGDLASATPIMQTPIASSYVAVFVNGVGARVANGPSEQTTRDCYFSADLGVTAKAFGAVAIGDRLYWNGSIAGYELETSDRLAFLYTSS